MLTAVKGTWQNGHIVLEEQPPITEGTAVIVTFLTVPAEAPEAPQTPVRRIGSLKGQFTVPADFDEPLDDLKEYMY